MVTGYYDAELAANAAEPGFAFTLAKPVQEYVLIDIVTRLLRPEGRSNQGRLPMPNPPGAGDLATSTRKSDL